MAHEKEYKQRPLRLIGAEMRDAKARAFVGYDRCPECQAVPNAPCRDRDWGSSRIRDRAHPGRPKVEEA